MENNPFRKRIDLNTGDILETADYKYRILGFKKDLAFLIDMNSTKTEFISKDINKIIGMIEDNELTLVKKDSDDRYFNLDDLSESAKKSYLLKKELCDKVVQEFSPTFIQLKSAKGKKFVNELLESCDMPRNTFWRNLNAYLKSGFNPNSLIDKRGTRFTREKLEYKKRTGSSYKTNSESNSQKILTEEDYKWFEEARQNRNKKRVATYKDAFNKMIKDHYYEIVETENGRTKRIKADSELPTMRQFKYYYSKMTGTKEKQIKMSSEQEQRNNNRLLFSDSLNGVLGPGSKFEVDECEMDVQIVMSRDRSKVVSRPVLYVMVDARTRLAVAWSLGLDNNSYIGITSCLANLLVDKVKRCKEIGIDIPEDFWPYNILPDRIQSDNGAEYISYNFEGLCNSLGISHSVAPPATGSLKGIVEQFFHQINCTVDFHTSDHGLITKRHDSTHFKDATLTIEEFEKVIITCLISHNFKYMESYPRTPQQIEGGVWPSPVMLWKEGVYEYGSPRVITEPDQFRYKLLLPLKVTISRSGIQYKTLYYLDKKNDWLLEKMRIAGTRREPLEVRIDPRNVNKVYLLDENKHIVAVPLNLQKETMECYQDMSLSEYESIRTKQLEQNREGAKYNEKLERYEGYHIESIVNNAVSQRVPVSAKDVRTNTAIEKAEVRAKNPIVPAGAVVPNEELIPQKKEVDKTVVEDITLEELLEDYI